MRRSRASERGEAELVAIVFGLFVVIVLLFKCGADVSGASHQTAEKEARKYAEELSIHVQGVTCAGLDSDGDGYVSCTISTAEGKLIGVECAGAMTINSGCRIPKLRAGTITQ